MNGVLLKREIKDFILRSFTRFYGWFHPVKKQILFSSWGHFADSEREIGEQMHRLFPDYKLVWLLADKPDKYHMLPDYITPIFVKDKLTFYKQLAVSFCFISNVGLRPNIYKRRKQLFIQTWHGDRPIKKIGYEMDKFSTSFPCRIIDNLLTDFCVSGSDKGTIQYREAFRYKGEIVQQGMPRNDKLITKEFDPIAIKKRLNIPQKCKVLLYAPTFRDNLVDKQQVLVDLTATLKVLKQKYPSKPWVCLLRAHNSSAGFKEYDKGIINVSDYPDMTDLLCITDILLTDYSSCAGDFILMRKPVILTIFDSKKYQQCRSLKYPLEETGFMLAHNQEELEQKIKSLTEDIINCFGKI